MLPCVCVCVCVVEGHAICTNVYVCDADNHCGEELLAVYHVTFGGAYIWSWHGSVSGSHSAALWKAWALECSPSQGQPPLLLRLELTILPSLRISRVSTFF